MFGKKKPDFAAFAHQKGQYTCSGCGQGLFKPAHRFEAGCGFPSFYTHLSNGVHLNPLDTYGRHRIQLLCSSCGQHLGHLFKHSHTPTGLRYCIHTNAITHEEF